MKSVSIMTGVGLKVSTLLVRTKLSMPTEMNTAHLFNDNIIGYQDLCFQTKAVQKLLTFFFHKNTGTFWLCYSKKSQLNKHMKIFGHQRSRSFLMTYFDQSNLNSSNTFFLKDNGNI